jgi:hypothetical protein
MGAIPDFNQDAAPRYREPPRPSKRYRGYELSIIITSPSIPVLLRVSEVMPRFNEIKDSAPAEYWWLSNPGLVPAVEVPA